MRFVLTTTAPCTVDGCWKYVLEETRRSARRPRSIAPDPSGPRRVGCGRNRPPLDGYRDALLDVLEPDDVLVGHIPSAAAFICFGRRRRAVRRFRRLIYISGTSARRGSPPMAEVMPFVKRRQGI